MGKAWRIIRTVLFVLVFVAVYAVAVVAAMDGTSEHIIALVIFTLASIFALPKMIKTLAQSIERKADGKTKRRMIFYLVASVLLGAGVYFFLVASPTPIEDLAHTAWGIFIGIFACFLIIELCFFYLPRIMGMDDE